MEHTEGEAGKMQAWRRAVERVLYGLPTKPREGHDWRGMSLVHSQLLDEELTRHDTSGTWLTAVVRERFT